MAASLYQKNLTVDSLHRYISQLIVSGKSANTINKYTWELTRFLEFVFAQPEVGADEKLREQLEEPAGEEEITDALYKDKLGVLKYGLEQDFNFSTKHIPEEIIDAFVDEIVVCKDCFIWKLSFSPDDFKVDVKGRKNNYIVTQTDCSLNCSPVPSQPHRAAIADK